MFESVEVIFSLLSKIKDPYFTKSLVSMFFITIYKVFRLIFKYNPNNNSDFFAVSDENFLEVCNNMQENAEVTALNEIKYTVNSNKKPDIIDARYIRDNYKNHGFSIMAVVHITEKNGAGCPP